MKTIGDQRLNLPGRAPVMVLPETTLFPNASMPLFIFEPRYRAMLAWALEQHRMFCVALIKPGLDAAKSADDFHHVAGLGLVRACVQHADGTSHLVLQGLARVRLIDFVQEKPFRIAELREIESRPAGAEEGEMLSAQVLEICAHYRVHGVEIPDELDRKLERASDPAVLGDIVADSFVRDPNRRQHILEQGDVAERLRALIRHLGDEMP